MEEARKGKRKKTGKEAERAVEGPNGEKGGLSFKRGEG